MFEGFLELAITLFEKYGLIGLFIIMIIGTSPIPIPADFIVVFVIALGAPPIWTGVFAALGASVGGLTFYFIGYGVIKATNVLEKQKAKIEKAHEWLERYGVFAVFLFALAPLPYDAIATAAGVVKMGIKKFLVATFLGRLLRYLFLAGAGYEALKYLSLPSLF